MSNRTTARTVRRTQPLTQNLHPRWPTPRIVSYSITRNIRGTQIPIAPDELPSSPFPRFPPLEVFRRRPPMRVAASISGRHPKTFTIGDLSRCSSAWTELRLLDHLVGAREQGLGYVKAERLRGLQIEHQFILRRCLHRQVGGFLAL
jgi:hypothetical protein